MAINVSIIEATFLTWEVKNAVPMSYKFPLNLNILQSSQSCLQMRLRGHTLVIKPPRLYQACKTRYWAQFGCIMGLQFIVLSKNSTYSWGYNHRKKLQNVPLSKDPTLLKHASPQGLIFTAWFLLWNGIG